MNAISVAALVLLLLSILFGIWTGMKGTPYSIALLTVHKLSSIVCIVLGVLFYIRIKAQFGLFPYHAVWIISLIVSIAALIATGGIMAGKPDHSNILRITHIAASAVLTFSAFWPLLNFINA